MAPWERVRLLALPGDVVLLDLPNHGAPAEISHSGGEWLLRWGDRYGPIWQALIDPATRSFRFHPHDEPEDLARFFARMAETLQPPPPPRSRLATAFAVFNVIGSAVLTAGGAWMALDATTTKDRAIGALGVVFFGASLWSFWRELKPPKVPAPRR